MRAFFDHVARVFAWMDALEFAIYAIFGALLLVIGPPLACLYLLRMNQYGSASLCVGLWIFSTVICIRDLRRRHFSPMGLALGMLWLFTTMIFGWMADVG